jgi:hypothetical protein
VADPDGGTDYQAGDVEMMDLTRRGILVAATFLACGIGRVGTGAVVPLPSDVAALIGNSAVVGDDTFNFIRYTNNQNPTGGGNPIPPSSISVSALTGTPPGPPFGFELTGPIAAIPNAVNSNDILLQYTVKTPLLISSVNLSASSQVSGNGLAEVVESVFVNNNGVQGAFLGQIAVLGSGTATLNLGGGFASLYIVDDIQFGGFGPTDTASISAIQQTFNEAVPEPSSLVLCGVAGVVGLAVARWRRRQVA